MVISKPLRSAMSNLLNVEEDSHRLRYEDVPIKIVIENLDSGRLDSSVHLLGDRDEDGWIWFPNEVTLFALPLEGIPKARSMRAKKYPGPTDSSQLNTHRKVSVPVDLNSTTWVGL